MAAIKRKTKYLPNNSKKKKRRNIGKPLPFEEESLERKKRAKRKSPEENQGVQESSGRFPRPYHQNTEVSLHACPTCDGPVERCTRRVQHIEEISKAKPHVTQLITYVGYCPQCEKEIESNHPFKSPQRPERWASNWNLVLWRWRVGSNMDAGFRFEKRPKYSRILQAFASRPGDWP